MSRPTSTDNALLKELKRLGAKLEKAPSARQYDSLRRKKSSPSTATIRARFGTWNAALAAAGLTPAVERASIQTYSDEDMTKMLVEAGKSLDGNLTFSSYDKLARERGWARALTVTNRFGGWNAALAAAGLTEPVPS